MQLAWCTSYGDSSGAKIAIRTNSVRIVRPTIAVRSRSTPRMAAHSPSWTSTSATSTFATLVLMR